MAELEARIRKSVPHFTDRAITAYLHCFRTRPDGTVEARLTRARHLSILRSLWEHRPSTRWATLKTPAHLLLADAGDEARTATKRRAEASALAAGSKVRSTWFSPGHHDLHLEFPERRGRRALAPAHRRLRLRRAREPLVRAVGLARLAGARGVGHQARRGRRGRVLQRGGPDPRALQRAGVRDLQGRPPRALARWARSAAGGRLRRVVRGHPAL